MQIGKGIRGGTVARLKKAVEMDNSIVTDRDKLGEATGHDPEYLAYLGLQKTDLKRLERYGFAIRGYTKNIWLAGEKRPDGSIVPKGMRAVGRGHRVRWVLVGSAE